MPRGPGGRQQEGHDVGQQAHHLVRYAPARLSPTRPYMDRFLSSAPVPVATLDGGVGLLLPMQEKTYRRLLMLQNALTTMLSHHAGLNPKAFRCVGASP